MRVCLPIAARSPFASRTHLEIPEISRERGGTEALKTLLIDWHPNTSVGRSSRKGDQRGEQHPNELPDNGHSRDHDDRLTKRSRKLHHMMTTR